MRKIKKLTALFMAFAMVFMFSVVAPISAMADPIMSDDVFAYDIFREDIDAIRYEILTSTFAEPIGVIGFERYDFDSTSDEIIEIGVQFRTPSAVALRLLYEEEYFNGESVEMQSSFYDQALVAHTDFFEQFAELVDGDTELFPFEIISQHHELFNGIFLRVPAFMISEIAALPEVFLVEPNRVYFADDLTFEDVVYYSDFEPFSNNDPFLRGTRQLFDLDYIHNTMGITGQGVRVAVIDTGIANTHPRVVPFHEPGTNWVRGWNYIENIRDNTGLPGTNSHGTACTAPVMVIAPGVELWKFRIGSGNSGDTNAMISAVEHSRRVGVQVLNRSFSLTGLFSSMMYTMNLAVLDGMVVINSTGNVSPTNYGGPFSTARTGLFISVGNGQGGSDNAGMNNRDGVSTGSLRGPAQGTFHIKPDIVAPGTSVNSLTMGGSYAQTSGTSLSAPMIAGVAALLIEQFPDADPFEIMARMMNTARPLEVRGTTEAIRITENSVFNVGAGFVQPIQALRSGTAYATVRTEVPCGSTSFPAHLPTDWPREIPRLREINWASLSFGATWGNESHPLTVTIHNPGAGTWIPDIRWNGNHAGVNLQLLNQTTSATAQTFTYQMTFGDDATRGAYQGSIVFTNTQQPGQFITMPFGTYYGWTQILELTPNGNHDFGVVAIGSETALSPPIFQVNVRNIGSVFSPIRRIILSGENADSFILSSSTISGLSENATTTFTIRPRPDLPLGEHIATIAVMGVHEIRNEQGEITQHNDPTQFFDVRFTVQELVVNTRLLYNNVIYDEPILRRGQTLRVETSVCNGTGEPIEPMLIIAAFNNGVFIGSRTETATSPLPNSQTLNLDIEFPILATGVDEVRVLVWEKTTMTPYVDPIILRP